MTRFLSSLSQNQRIFVSIAAGLFIALVMSFLTVFSVVIPAAVIVCSLFVVYIAYLFRDPSIGLNTLVVYCFTLSLFSRELSSAIPFGIGIEVFLLLIWIAVLILNKEFDWKSLNNDLVKLMLAWFIISFIEVINPAGASVRGWIQEIRSTALFPILSIPLAFLLFNSEKKLDTFLVIILLLSFFASLNGIKQQHIGLSDGEQRFLDEGGAVTHVLWGKLRVFSFYSEAGQFGASQASFVLVALMLALGPFKIWKRILLFLLSIFFVYGMLISGTRGALFALITGAFFAIFLTKNVKILSMGFIAALLFIFVLKFTSIGNGNYAIYRMRTGLDPQEASLNVRLNNQRVLSEYLRGRPFGGGLGVIGAWGKEYNKDKFLSTIEPDSYWVKLWAMYGIVGFTLWFCMIMYLLGKCCGIIWKIKSERLRYKAIALISSSAGIFFCSYGNEVMNAMPSAIVVSFSFAFVFMCPKFDKEQELLVNNELIT
ncbi:hypothetical protein D3C87_590560 [compost metagenome]